MSLLKMSVISYLNDWTECHLKAIRHHWHGNLIALTLPAEPYQLSWDMWTTNRWRYHGGRACCCNKAVTNQQMTISWRTCLLLQ